MRLPRRTRTPRTAAAGLAVAAAVLTLVPATAAEAAPVAAPVPAPVSASANASAPGGNAAILGIDYAAWQREVAALVDAARPAIEQRIANSPAGEKPPWSSTSTTPRWRRTSTGSGPTRRPPSPRSAP